MLLNEIRRLCKSTGVTIAAVEREIGFGQGTIGKWDKSIPTVDRLEKIADYFGVSLDELLGRSTARPFISTADRDLLRDVHELDEDGRDFVLTVIRRELDRIRAAAENRPRLVPLPRSLQPASAGRGAYLGAEEMEIVYVDATPQAKRASFIVPVSGSSMEPLYHDGDQLLVERADDIEIGEIGVFTVNGDGFVKRRGDGVLMSLNPAFPDVPITEDSWCNGRVIAALKQSDIKL